MELDQLLQINKQKIDQQIEALLSYALPFQMHQDLFQAAHYALFPSGKRLRPLLASLVLADLQQDVERALTPLCSLELLHTYSLIHDDLPCMDNDDFRRSRPTLHKAFPEWLALLTGDFLLTFSFEVCVLSHSLSPREKVELVTLLSRQAGGVGMVGGQFLDLYLEGRKSSWREIRSMYVGKTSSLLAASLEFGAILGGITDLKDLAALRRTAKYLGIAYQIQDDLMNCFSQETTIGKPVGSDQRRKKANMLLLFGELRTKKALQTFTRLTFQALSSCSFPTNHLREFCQKIFKRSF